MSHDVWLLFKVYCFPLYQTVQETEEAAQSSKERDRKMYKIGK